MISPHRERQIARASAALTARGGGFVDLPTLVPASLVLELAGEGLRPRLFFATAPDGSEMCLRPDLTIPAAVHYVAKANYDNEPFAWACKGPVFRAPRLGEDRPPEFVQIGLERFGDRDIIATDVTIFLAAWNACTGTLTDAPKVRFCDGGLLPLILAKANLPDVWRVALSEHVGHTRSFLAVLDQASGEKPARTISDLERQLVTMSPEAATARVEQALADSDLSLAGERSLEDVTRRLLTRARRVIAPPLPPITAATLRALATFKQDNTPEDAVVQIVALAMQLGVDLTAWQGEWSARFAAIQAEAPDAFAACRFDALGEEAFDYYDGLAFDIASNDDFRHPVATGGRYDRLVCDISGGTRHARAIGCVIRPDRFAPDVNGEA